MLRELVYFLILRKKKGLRLFCNAGFERVETNINKIMQHINITEAVEDIIKKTGILAKGNE